MPPIWDTSTEELRARLAEVESAKAAKRLVVALDYADGVAVDDMSERYGIPRSTIYYWLDRFENRSLEEAIEDEPRPGRPPKLDREERQRLEEALDEPPSEHGFTAESWEPEVVRRHIEREYGVTYSLGHVRRLLREREG